MGWHTDSHRPGWRIYVYRLFSGRAAFHYNNTIIVENEGIGGYVFRTGFDCWHAIETNGSRISFGLKIDDEMMTEIVSA